MRTLGLGGGVHSRSAVLATTIAVLFSVPPACGGHDRRPAQYAELNKRASFDLRCEKVKITPIKEDDYMSCSGKVQYAQTAGVTCGEQRATYELVQGRWLMNNESGADERAK
jgi:hypothetical protein